MTNFVGIDLPLADQRARRYGKEGQLPFLKRKITASVSDTRHSAEIDPLVPHQIDEPMLLRNPARDQQPYDRIAGAQACQSPERVAQHLLDELQNTQRDWLRSVAIQCSEIVPKLGMKDRRDARDQGVWVFIVFKAEAAA